MNTVVPGDTAEAHALQHLADRLVMRFGLAPEMIDAEISLALSEFTAAPIRDFVAILVERAVVDRIGQMQRQSAVPASPAPVQGEGR